MESIVDHSVDGAIRWDRIANDSRANPNFEYSAHGLLHRWVQHQRKPGTEIACLYRRMLSS